jgi:hypothetical protein
MGTKWEAMAVRVPVAVAVAWEREEDCLSIPVQM